MAAEPALSVEAALTRLGNAAEVRGGRLVAHAEPVPAGSPDSFPPALIVLGVRFSKDKVLCAPAAPAGRALVGAALGLLRVLDSRHPV